MCCAGMNSNRNMNFFTFACCIYLSLSCESHFGHYSDSFLVTLFKTTSRLAENQFTILSIDQPRMVPYSSNQSTNIICEWVSITVINSIYSDEPQRHYSPFLPLPHKYIEIPFTTTFTLNVCSERTVVVYILLACISFPSLIWQQLCERVSCWGIANCLLHFGNPWSKQLAIPQQLT